MNTPLAAPMPALVALIGLAVAWASPADAGPVPDTVQIAMMQQAIADVPLVRVRGEFGARSGYKPRLDASGVRLAETLEGSHGAMRSVVANTGEVELLPWNRISSLETERSGTMGTSMLVGAALGLAVGTAIALAKTDFSTTKDQTHRVNTTIAVSTLSGAALGALIGRHRKWRTVYPPAMREDGR